MRGKQLVMARSSMAAMAQANDRTILAMCIRSWVDETKTSLLEAAAERQKHEVVK